MPSRNGAAGSDFGRQMRAEGERPAATAAAAAIIGEERAGAMSRTSEEGGSGGGERAEAVMRSSANQQVNQQANQQQQHYLAIRAAGGGQLKRYSLPENERCQRAQTGWLPWAATPLVPAHCACRACSAPHWPARLKIVGPVTMRHRSPGAAKQLKVIPSLNPPKGQPRGAGSRPAESPPKGGGGGGEWGACECSIVVDRSSLAGESVEDSASSNSLDQTPASHLSARVASAASDSQQAADEAQGARQKSKSVPSSRSLSLTSQEACARCLQEAGPSRGAGGGGVAPLSQPTRAELEAEERLRREDEDEFDCSQSPTIPTRFKANSISSCGRLLTSCGQSPLLAAAAAAAHCPALQQQQQQPAARSCCLLCDLSRHLALLHETGAAASSSNLNLNLNLNSNTSSNAASSFQVSHSQSFASAAASPKKQPQQPNQQQVGEKAATSPPPAAANRKPSVHNKDYLRPGDYFGRLFGQSAHVTPRRRHSWICGR